MRYIYQCYFYIFVGNFFQYKRKTICGPIHSCYEFALSYLENIKKTKQHFCAGFIYEFEIDNPLYGTLIYKTDEMIDEPDLFSEIHDNSKISSVILNR